MADPAAIAGFLKKLHLFIGLNEAQLKMIAVAMRELPYSETSTVFEEGTPADGFYLIFKGRVNVTRKVKGRDVRLASLFAGDYFGEQSLLTGNKHNATVKAEPGTVLLSLDRETFRGLLKKIPGMKPNFLVMMESRKLARNTNTSWLGQDEVIYFMARKHWFLLARAMILPSLIMVLALVALFIAFELTSPGFAAMGGFLAVISTALGFWEYVDWGNDYYIVTNQRVIWLEKVVLLYDSRTEAPMSTILSVNLETDEFGRRLHYGTVIVRTFTGQIRMEFVNYPRHAESMIKEYWERTKERSQKLDEEIIKNAIRAKVGKPPVQTAVPAGPAAPSGAPSVKKVSPLANWFRNNFGMRVEESGTVTYHKHWIILLRDIWLQTLIFLGVLVIMIAGMVLLSEARVAVLVIGLIALTAAGAWWYYIYIDWKNDIYQLTADQIIDVYKKPLGAEDRRSAPIDGILSTEYKRSGIFGMVFNYGTVFINVGGEKYDFVDVADPPGVHHDINARFEVRKRKKREGEIAAERDRMAEWLAMYYKTIQAIEDSEKDKK
jgi:CRP-like cAMP-binding protein